MNLLGQRVRRSCISVWNSFDICDVYVSVSIVIPRVWWAKDVSSETEMDVKSMKGRLVKFKTLQDSQECR